MSAWWDVCTAGRVVECAWVESSLESSTGPCIFSVGASPPVGRDAMQGQRARAAARVRAVEPPAFQLLPGLISDVAGDTLPISVRPVDFI